MSTHGKKYDHAYEHVPHGQILPAKEALAKLKEVAYAKFDETVDADVNLGIDASKGEGVTVKKRQEMERVAEANKAFSHFRW